MPKLSRIVKGTGRTDEIGELVYSTRMEMGLTQDEFGARYEISGPAVFKFEKGFVRPSLRLWISIAEDTNVPERRAVLIWLKAKLPQPYKKYVDLGSEKPRAQKKGDVVDYARFEERKAMQEAAAADKTLPKPLRDLLADDELWSLYRPTGHEINMLRNTFGSLGKGSTRAYREALRLVREFSHSF